MAVGSVAARRRRCAHDVMPVEAEVESEVVARPRGDADERQPVLARDSRDDRKRPIAARNAERISAICHCFRNELCEPLAGLEDDDVDPSFPCQIENGGAHAAAARIRVHEQDWIAQLAHLDKSRSQSTVAGCRVPIMTAAPASAPTTTRLRSTTSASPLPAFH